LCVRVGGGCGGVIDRFRKPPLRACGEQGLSSSIESTDGQEGTPSPCLALPSNQSIARLRPQLRQAKRVDSRARRVNMAPRGMEEIEEGLNNSRGHRSLAQWPLVVWRSSFPRRTTDDGV